MNTRRLMLQAAGSCTFATVWADVLGATNYPDRALTMVVPSVAGGAIDATARAVAHGLARQLGASVVVDNRPGAANTLGATHVQRLKADGYTLLVAPDATMVSAPYLLPVQPYRPQQDFSAIGTLATFPYVLVTAPQKKFASTTALVQAGRSRPGEITCASGGEGSIHHLVMEAFQQATGVRFKHVPYKAAPQGFIDVMGGHVDLMFIAPGTAAGPIKAGKIHALGHSGTNALPELPQLAQLRNDPACPQFVFESWFGLFSKQGTASEVQQRLHQALNLVLETREFKEQMTQLGLIPRQETPEQLNQRIVQDTLRFAPVVAQLKKNGNTP